MKITSILDKECVRVPLQASDKTSVITELVDLLNETGHLTDRDAVLRAVLDREKTRSTGIGTGLAVPHGKSSGCNTLCIAIGKPASPMEFDSADGAPCEIIVLLASPVDKTGPHIQALASVSRLWLKANLREEVSSSNSAEEVFAAIQRHED